MPSNMPGTLVGSNSQQTTTVSPAKIVPLLQQINRAEELTAALVMRLDPITQHESSIDSKDSPASTVTTRITLIGDALQYLLDHIEL